MVSNTTGFRKATAMSDSDRVELAKKLRAEASVLEELDGLNTASPIMREAANELDRASAEGGTEGNGEACYYCGEPCKSYAGNPARWPIPLCHRNDPGVVKWHHIGCVTDRLIENQPSTPAPQAPGEEGLREILARHLGVEGVFDVPIPVAAILSAMKEASRLSPSADLLAAAKAEFGWVIEHGASEISRPRYWGGVHGWTYDNLKAVRFAREIDAQSQAEADDDGVPNNYRIKEHGWG